MIEDLDEKYDGVTTCKIGKVVNKETVLYEKRGLIPTPDRRRSGYRIFTQRHIDQIKFIKRAQQLGFTLSEIKELLELRLDEEALQSTITCPKCGEQSTEEMPTNSCQYFWECPNCSEVLKPQQGDCCVFCSYGNTPCPPVQKKESCC